MATFNQNRRQFLRGNFKSAKLPIRLPWVISEAVFSADCLRCTDCVAACEEEIIVIGQDGLPEIDFSRGECTFCRACREICPQPLFTSSDRISAWQCEMSIEKSCLSHQSIFCQSCRESCEQDAIKFNFMETSIPVPTVDNELCNGCGACISVCPTQATQLSILYD